MQVKDVEDRAISTPLPENNGQQQQLRSSPLTDDVFKEWRKADLAARDAERAMFEQAMLAFDGLSSPTSKIDAQQVKALRQRANELFHLAMASSKAPSDVPAAADL